jgi:hypothetical protein
VINGAKRKTKPSTSKNAKEKFNLVEMNSNLFLNINRKGIIRRKSITENNASIILKFRKESAEEGSLINKSK